MVEAHEDPEFIHSQRSYDVIKSREFAERGIRRPAGADTEGRLYLSDGPAEPEQAELLISAAPDTEATMLVAAPTPPPPPPIDAAAALRRARLAVCVCLVLALMLAWVAQRRGEIPKADKP